MVWGGLRYPRLFIRIGVISFNLFAGNVTVPGSDAALPMHTIAEVVRVFGFFFELSYFLGFKL